MTPPAEHKVGVQPPKEHGGTVTPPVEHKVGVQPPKEHGGAVTTPVAQRQPASVQPREPKVFKPERVTIPVSPVSGRPDVPGVPRATPPVKPVDESKYKEGKDIRGKAVNERTRTEEDMRSDK